MTNSCWSTKVQPGVPCKVTFPAGSILNITGFSLDIDPKQLPTASGKIVLSISVNGSKPITIMSFIVGRYDSAVVNILLGKNDTAVLTSSGENIPVNVSGCLVNYKSNQKSSPTISKSPVGSTSKNQPHSSKKSVAPTAKTGATTKNAPASKSLASAVKKAPTVKKPIASKSKK